MNTLLGRQTRRPDSPPHTIYYNALRLPDRVTELPDNPRRGDVVRYSFTTDNPNDIVWWLYYDEDSTNTYKWVPFAPASLYDNATQTTVTTTSASYVNLFSTALQITVPLGGVYRIQWGWQAQHSVASALGWMAIKNGSAATVDIDGVRGQAPAANYDLTGKNGDKEFTTTDGAGNVFLAQFKTNAATLTVNNAGQIHPWMSVTPIRVG